MLDLKLSKHSLAYLEKVIAENAPALEHATNFLSLSPVFITLSCVALALFLWFFSRRIHRHRAYFLSASYFLCCVAVTSLFQGCGASGGLGRPTQFVGDGSDDYLNEQQSLHFHAPINSGKLEILVPRSDEAEALELSRTYLGLLEYSALSADRKVFYPTFALPIPEEVNAYEWDAEKSILTIDTSKITRPVGLGFKFSNRLFVSFYAEGLPDAAQSVSEGLQNSRSLTELISELKAAKYPVEARTLSTGVIEMEYQLADSRKEKIYVEGASVQKASKGTNDFLKNWNRRFYNQNDFIKSNQSLTVSPGARATYNTLMALQFNGASLDLPFTSGSPGNISAEAPIDVEGPGTLADFYPQNLSREEALGATKVVLWQGFSTNQLRQLRLFQWAFSAAGRPELADDQTGVDPNLPPAVYEAPTDPLSHLFVQLPSFRSIDAKKGQGLHSKYGRGMLLNLGSPNDMAYENPAHLLQRDKSAPGVLAEIITSFYRSGLKEGLGVGTTVLQGEAYTNQVNRRLTTQAPRVSTEIKFSSGNGQSIRDIKERNLFMGMLSFADVTQAYAQLQGFETSFGSITAEPEELYQRLQEYVALLEPREINDFTTACQDYGDYMTITEIDPETEEPREVQVRKTKYFEAEMPEIPKAAQGASHVYRMSQMMQCLSYLQRNGIPIPELNIFSWFNDRQNFFHLKANAGGGASIYFNLISELCWTHQDTRYCLRLNPWQVYHVLRLRKLDDKLFDPHQNIAFSIRDPKNIWLTNSRLMVPEALQKDLFSIWNAPSLNYETGEYLRKAERLSLRLHGRALSSESDKVKPAIYQEVENPEAGDLDQWMTKDRIGAFTRVVPSAQAMNQFSLSGDYRYKYFRYQRQSDGSYRGEVVQNALSYIECSWNQLNPHVSGGSVNLSANHPRPQFFDIDSSRVGCGWGSTGHFETPEAPQWCVRYCQSSQASGPETCYVDSCGDQHCNTEQKPVISNVRVMSGAECGSSYNDTACGEGSSAGIFRASARYTCEDANINGMANGSDDRKIPLERPNFYPNNSCPSPVSCTSDANCPPAYTCQEFGSNRKYCQSPGEWWEQFVEVPGRRVSESCVWEERYGSKPDGWSGAWPPSSRTEGFQRNGIQFPVISSGGYPIFNKEYKNLCDWRSCRQNMYDPESPSEPTKVRGGLYPTGRVRVAWWGDPNVSADVACNNLCGDVADGEPVAAVYPWEVLLDHPSWLNNRGETYPQYKFYDAQEVWEDIRKPQLESLLEEEPQAEQREILSYFNLYMVTVANGVQTLPNSENADTPRIRQASGLYNSHTHTPMAASFIPGSTTGFDETNTDIGFPEGNGRYRGGNPAMGFIRDNELAPQINDLFLFSGSEFNYITESMKYWQHPASWYQGYQSWMNQPDSDSGTWLDQWRVQRMDPGWVGRPLSYNDAEKTSFEFENGIPLVQDLGSGTNEWVFRPFLPAAYRIAATTYRVPVYTFDRPPPYADFNHDYRDDIFIGAYWQWSPEFNTSYRNKTYSAVAAVILNDRYEIELENVALGTKAALNEPERAEISHNQTRWFENPNASTRRALAAPNIPEAPGQDLIAKRKFYEYLAVGRVNWVESSPPYDANEDGILDPYKFEAAEYCACPQGLCACPEGFTWNEGSQSCQCLGHDRVAKGNQCVCRDPKKTPSSGSGPCVCDGERGFTGGTGVCVCQEGLTPSADGSYCFSAVSGGGGGGGGGGSGSGGCYPNFDACSGECTSCCGSSSSGGGSGSSGSGGGSDGYTGNGDGVGDGIDGNSSGNDPWNPPGGDGAGSTGVGTSVGGGDGYSPPGGGNWPGFSSGGGSSGGSGGASCGGGKVPKREGGGWRCVDPEDPPSPPDGSGTGGEDPNPEPEPEPPCIGNQPVDGGGGEGLCEPGSMCCPDCPDSGENGCVGCEYQSLLSGGCGCDPGQGNETCPDGTACVPSFGGGSGGGICVPCSGDCGTGGGTVDGTSDGGCLPGSFPGNPGGVGTAVQSGSGPSSSTNCPIPHFPGTFDVREKTRVNEGPISNESRQ